MWRAANFSARRSNSSVPNSTASACRGRQSFSRPTPARPTKQVGHYVAEVIFPNTIPPFYPRSSLVLQPPANDAGDLANRAVAIVAAVRRLRFAPPNEGLRVSVSVGACLCAPSSAWPSWYSDADSALYQAKGSGGDGWKLSE